MIVHVDRGSASLGSWGSLELTGSRSATIRTPQAEDVEVPEEVANELPAAIVILNPENGHLISLPYAGETVLSLDLGTSTPVNSLMTIPRDQDHGMRIADFRLVSELGVVYLTERSLALFNEDLRQVWRHDGDFMGWSFEGVTPDEIYLLTGDWSGYEEHQTRSMINGNVIIR